MYPCNWKGSEDPENESGTVNFMVDGLEYVFGLECFEDSQKINKMLDVAFDQGRSFGAGAIRDAVTITANQRANDLGA
jgi:hypothetical protein